MSGWYLAPKSYQGLLNIGECSLSVSFNAGIDQSGDVKITLQPIPLNSDSRFIEDHYYEQKTQFAEFSLSGDDGNGATFTSTKILVYSPGHFFSDSLPASVTPRIGCMQCSFIEPSTEGSSRGAKLLLRDFKNYFPLRAHTPLGEVEMTGANALEVPASLTGSLAVAAPADIGSFSQWKICTSELFTHVCSVMSFAQGGRLAAPVTKWLNEDFTEIEVTSILEMRPGAMAPFSPFDFATIFQTAVNTYFDRQIDAKDLRIAIEWFNMPSVYREGKLLAAMTVLEHLISASLSRRDLEIRSKTQFRDLRKELLAVVEKKIAEWTQDPQLRATEMDAIRDKFEDLNRRSLKQKIDLLASRWGVDLSDLEPEEIASAKRARDHIVHTGRFEFPAGVSGDLMDYVRLTREIVVRFILAALKFEGTYTSYVGGAHNRHFVKGISLDAKFHRETS
ncbi:hypothetical protein [Pseudoduganella sp. R-34]|uniref:hypothetical protein n=1 Tax=Pseudoduganella sp. R-34 TaxID=3404062 RepID=UPI003CEA6DB4